MGELLWRIAMGESLWTIGDRLFMVAASVLNSLPLSVRQA